MTDIKKSGSTSYVVMGQFQNDVLYIRYRSKVHSIGVSLCEKNAISKRSRSYIKLLYFALSDIQ